MFLLFFTIHAFDRWTDGQPERRTFRSWLSACIDAAQQKRK